MCLGSQRASLYKERLGYTPKKGKTAFAPLKTSFVKNNDQFYTSCKQVGHKEHECKNKSKKANVSSIKINSFYVLTKGTNGVKLSSLVHHAWAQRRKPFRCQRAWSLTFKDPSKFGYLKRIDLLFVGQLQSRRKALGS